jgi:Protein of unknown function (DUF4058)
LRSGPHVLAVPEYAARREAEYDYLICVNRAKEPRDTYEIYPRRLRERLPRLGVPLAESDPDVVLDLQAVVAKVYEAGVVYQFELFARFRSASARSIKSTSSSKVQT